MKDTCQIITNPILKSLTAKQLQIVKDLKILAEKKYAKGWDFFVECYDDEAWADFMISDFNKPITTKKDALKWAKIIVDIRKDRELDCRSGDI